MALHTARTKRVAGRVPIIVDSGVRRGIDVFKLIAMGADAVAIGRPVLWGLINGGSLGVKAVHEHLVRELKDAMLLAGRAKVGDIERAGIVSATFRISSALTCGSERPSDALIDDNKGAWLNQMTKVRKKANQLK
jgi:isopentenyl diphosphate isomerase/L-lactate dehydrogenase-like FMN-dependent dehydrogenase